LKFSATEAASILEKVQLKNLVENRGGLDAAIMTESLSHGEQQLLAVGRAILRKRSLNGEFCVLILDEATSNLDAVSETIFQQIIREEFQNDTVISVAHRLETLKDCDSISVWDKGKVVTIGAPIDVMGQISWGEHV
jgi:ATP-binding cassette subfamily C (CFTR/MRP) protein 1